MRSYTKEDDEQDDNVATTTETRVIQPPKKTRYTYYHVTTFLLTFIRYRTNFVCVRENFEVFFRNSSYGMLHAARKVFSNVKSTMADEWSPLENETVTGIQPSNVKQFHFDLFFVK